MLIPIVILMGMVVGLFYGVYQEIETAIEKKENSSFDKQLKRYQMDLKIEEMKQFYRDRDLMELDKMERLETIQTGTNWIYNELQKETDPKKRTQLQKEMERLQKQHYITKYKE